MLRRKGKMKSKSMLSAVIFVLLTLSNLAVAQDIEISEKQIGSRVSAPQRRVAELRLLEPTGRIRCLLGMQQTVLAGIFDNIVLPTEATYKDAALLSIYPASTTNYKDFDDPGLNKVVGQSFSLKDYKPCEGRTCSVLLEIAVCNSGKDLWQNDKLYVGNVEAGKLNPSIFYGDIWKPTEGGQCKNISIPIAPSTIATWPALQVVIQDDTTVDNIKLTLNY
jgi:hypothetical protein